MVDLEEVWMEARAEMTALAWEVASLVAFVMVGAFVAALARVAGEVVTVDWNAVGPFLVKCFTVLFNVFLAFVLWSGFNHVSGAQDVKTWPQDLCTVTDWHVHCYGGCSGITYDDGDEVHDLFYTWARVTTTNGRELIAFPEPSGAPFAREVKYKEWSLKFGPLANGAQRRVPCAVNPEYTDYSCTEGPLEGDSCDVINAPARCRACLGRVMLGDEDWIAAHAHRVMGSAVVGFLFFCIIFVPLGIFFCLKAWNPNTWEPYVRAGRAESGVATRLPTRVDLAMC